MDMKKVFVSCSLALLVLLGGARAVSAAEEMGIITGGDKGTYYQFGLDLQKLVKPAGIDLKVHTSKGSIENVYAVYQRPGVPMGIVQSDVLAFVSRVQTDPVLQRIARKTKMVFPLYNEEIHLIGKKGIADFDDLAGRRVAIGRDGSGTYLTSRLLFRLSEVAPSEMVPIDTTEALAELKAGRVDAMFYVAGFPVKLLREDVAEKDQLALIPITNKSILEFYPQAEIPAGTYAWQPTAVTTAAVKAVLVSFDFRRRDCDNVGRFAQIMSKNLDTLQKSGHAKWKAVDFNFPLRGWEQYDCVRKYLGKAPVAPASGTTRSTANPVFDAIKGALDQ
jgi:TRAP transporter TAXI family solute receptor